MAERPDEYELDDYPERRYGEDTDRPAIGSREERFFQENLLLGEDYRSFLIRQQMIDSNKVSTHKLFLDGRRKEIKNLKKNILSDILEIPYEEVDETKFNLKVEPVDPETFKLYYDINKPLLKYNSKDNRIVILSKDNFERFKVKYTSEISRRYVEREMKTDFSIKSDLSAIDLEVRQSESEEHHRRIDNLEKEISRLEQFEEDSIEKGEEIERLKNELERTRVDKDSEIETTRDNLKLKSTQLVNACKYLFIVFY